MDELIEQQTNLQTRISRAFINFKKMGKERMTLGNCETRMANLTENWHAYEKNHYKLLCDEKVDAKEPYFANDMFAITEEQYLSALGDFRDHLEGLKATKVAVPGPPEPLVISQSKLPAIDLPTFSGKFQDWSHFRDLFQSLVRSRTDLPNVLKLHYLLSCLSDEAAALVESIPVTGDQFEQAWKILTDNYENARIIINNHLDNLFALKPMQSETAAEIRRISTATNTILNALEALQRPTEHWDDIIVYLTLSRLDIQSRKEWETLIGSSEHPNQQPTYEELKKFIDMRRTTLEMIEKTQKTLPTATSKPDSKFVNFRSAKKTPQSSSSTRVFHTAKEEDKCLLCAQPHFVMFCEAFKRKTASQRRDLVANRWHLCFNCLGAHSVKTCYSKKRCQKCSGRHHTLLHLDSSPDAGLVEKGSKPEVRTAEVRDAEGPGPATQVMATLRSTPKDTVLLTTARVYVQSNTGEKVLVRALIDQCSQSSFISQSLCQLLRLKSRPSQLNISGVGGMNSAACDKAVEITIQPYFTSTFSCKVTTHVLPKVSSYAPTPRMAANRWKHIEGLTLADPLYMEPGTIDVLLDATVHARIVEAQIRRGSENEPLATQTLLGWVLSGPAGPGATSRDNALVSHHCSFDSELSISLRRFWEIEELRCNSRIFTPEELECEQHFVSNVSRSSEGRYVVRLPLKSTVDVDNLILGDSYRPAVRMLYNMEKRFARDARLKEAYAQQMTDYMRQGHMRAIGTNLDPADLSRHFVLPHHGVVKESSTTTKLRTVYNGSFRTNRGISLNDVLHVGANLLPELSDLILNWRNYAIGFSTDIEKMFRQIPVHEADQHLQCIVWREDPSHPVTLFALTVLPFGLACSPFLANRTLRKLAEDYLPDYPLGAEILSNERYMDDILSGGHTMESAKDKQSELIKLLAVGGFPPRKWLANEPELLRQVPETALASETSLLFDSDAAFSVLGLAWNPLGDCFQFRPKIDNVSTPLTKRSVLSCIAKLFDPLGWLTPVIVQGKIFMQMLWLLKIDWDAELPPAEADVWKEWYDKLPNLNRLRIPRWTGYRPSANLCEIHGFADASQRAYGAVLYLRVISADGARVSILMAKSKVAPLKTLSIPRLELCAAHLLAKMTRHYLDLLLITGLQVHLWSDSTDVLYWLRDHPSRWQTFVANRCSEILTLTPGAHWHHVRSQENPADAASRGLPMDNFLDEQLWWTGPAWLSESIGAWPAPEAIPSSPTIDEGRTVHVVAVGNETPSGHWDLLDKFSDLNKLLRITSYCLRFLLRIIARTSVSAKRSYLFTSPSSSVRDITVETLEHARLSWIRLIQEEEFSAETRTLQRKLELPKNNALVKLNPKLQEGFLRVGGRLRHSLLPEEAKYPFILPASSRFTELIVEDCHRRTLHGGVQLTLSTLRKRYWILRGRQTVKSVLHRCLPCLRYQASSAYQKMGDLPPARVKPSRPFMHSGVDYAGPFRVRTTPGRGHASRKGYIVVFICLSTKAVHLEAASDYTTDAFMAAFKRFTSRRGRCFSLLSDQGTNFVGADATLREMFSESSAHSKIIARNLASDGTSWRFNPPAAPHFGGIWEAAVKSTKKHLHRVLGEKALTYEELSTLLCQIEACLNSRPLTPLSDDPSDLHTISPANILIGADSFVLDEPRITDEVVPPLKRWKLLTQMAQNFWDRWSAEYLQSLQQRNKWLSTQDDIQVDDLVLVRSELTSPAKWPLARVIEVHPGADGLVRAATLRTATSRLRRPIVKLVVLRAKAHEQ